MFRIPKHVVYQGVLQGISGGEVIQGTGGGETTTATPTGYGGVVIHTRYRDPKDALGQRGWTRREFVDVGETRIRSVTMTPYFDALLLEAVGQEVALSVVGGDPSKPNRHTVMAIRTPRGGVNRPSRKVLWAGSIFWVIKYWVGGVILALLALLGAMIAGAIFDPLLPVGAALAAVLLVYCLVLPFVASRRAFAAAAALGPAGHGVGVPAGVS